MQRSVITIGYAADRCPMLYLVGGELITTTVNLLPGFRIELRKCNYTAGRGREGWAAILGNLYSIAPLFLFKSISSFPISTTSPHDFSD